jgi:hypothetical protein
LNELTPRETVFTDQLLQPNSTAWDVPSVPPV